MVYALIALTILVYFFIIIRIFHGINDQKTVSAISKVKNFFKSDQFDKINTATKR